MLSRALCAAVQCVTCVCFCCSAFPRPEFIQWENVQLFSPLLRATAAPPPPNNFKTHPLQLMTYFSVIPVSRFELTYTSSYITFLYITFLTVTKKQQKQNRNPHNARHGQNQINVFFCYSCRGLVRLWEKESIWGYWWKEGDVQDSSINSQWMVRETKMTGNYKNKCVGTILKQGWKNFNYSEFHLFFINLRSISCYIYMYCTLWVLE